MKKVGWKYCKLGDVCLTINGLWKGKKEPFIRVGVLRNANFTKDFTLDYSKTEYLDVEVRQYEKRKLETGDLIVEKSGGSDKQPVGRTVLFEAENGEYSFSNFTSVLRIKNKNLFISKYLYYNILHIYWRGDTKTMQKATTGIHNLDFDRFLDLQILVCSYNDQQQIVEYLDTTFEKIDRIKEKAEKKIEDAKGLFQAALNEKLKMREGWKEMQLDEVIIHLRTGLNPRVHFKLNTLDATGYYITVRELKGFTFEVDEKTDRINKQALLRINERSNLKVGDVLFSGTGTIGKTAIVKELPLWWNIKEGVYAMTLDSNKLYSKLLVYEFMSNRILDNIIKKASGTTVKSIPMKELIKIYIPVPPLATQQQIVSDLDALNEKTNAIEHSCRQIISECDNLKQAILKQVFE